MGFGFRFHHKHSLNPEAYHQILRQARRCPAKQYAPSAPVAGRRIVWTGQIMRVEFFALYKFKPNQLQFNVWPSERLSDRNRNAMGFLQGLKRFYLSKHSDGNTSRGFNLWSDLRRLLPQLKIRHAFDVGANLGQSADEIRTHLPDCDLWCFEPIPATFEQLQKNLSRYSNCKLFPVALGATVCRGVMDTNQSASDNIRIISTDSSSESGDSGHVTVSIDTLDHFVSAHPIKHIDFLKIDTEGYDLDVLQGAKATLEARKISVIQVEAGMNPENQLHIPLQRFVDFLYPLDYLLFGIYEQMHEWPTREPHLRRSNAVFISRELIAAHRGTVSH